MTEPTTHETRTPTLTPRERDVLRLIAAGRSNTEIAHDLGLSFPTAKTHVSNILAKLKVDSREEAARWWDAHGKDSRPSVFASWSRRFGFGWGWRPVAIAGGVLAVSGVAVVAVLVALVATEDEDDGAAGLAPGLWVAMTGYESNTEGRRPTTPILLRNPGIDETVSLGPAREYVLVDLSPDGRHVAGAALPPPEQDGMGEDDEDLPPTVHIFDLVDGEEVVVPISSFPYQITWSPDGTRLAVFSLEGVTMHSAKGEVLGTTGFSPGGYSDKFWSWAPDSSKLAVLMDLHRESGDQTTLILAGRDGAPLVEIDASSAGAPALNGWWALGSWEDSSTLVLTDRGGVGSSVQWDWPLTVDDAGTVVWHERREADYGALSQRWVPIFEEIDEQYPGNRQFCLDCTVRDDGLDHIGIWFSPSTDLRAVMPGNEPPIPTDTQTLLILIDEAGAMRVIDTGLPPAPFSQPFEPAYDLVLVEGA